MPNIIEIVVASTVVMVIGAMFFLQEDKTMDLVKLLNDLIANINALQLQLADAQASADALATAKYDEGFAAGVASVTPQDPALVFSQADLDAAVKAAVDTAVTPLADQVAALQAQVEAAPAEKDAAIAKLKADIKAAYDSQQADESAGEAAVAALLS